jgi:glutamyl endopeptidase
MNDQFNEANPFSFEFENFGSPTSNRRGLKNTACTCGQGSQFSENEFEGDLFGDSESEHEVIRVDSRVRVRDTTVAPFRYICSIETPEGSGTGTLIGPSTVLTAGHVIVKGNSKHTQTPSTVRVVHGKNGSLEPLPATSASEIILHPDYVRVSATDIAIIKLQDPIGKTGYWNTKNVPSRADRTGTSILDGRLPLPAGTLKVNLSGYPGDKNFQQFRAYDLTVKHKDGILYYVNDTIAGHSGCPVWVRRHPSKGGRVLVGIHIDKRADDQKFIGNRGVLITPKIRKFILDHTS